MLFKNKIHNFWEIIQKQSLMNFCLVFCIVLLIVYIAHWQITFIPTEYYLHLLTINVFVIFFLWFKKLKNKYKLIITEFIVALFLINIFLIIISQTDQPLRLILSAKVVQLLFFSTLFSAIILIYEKRDKVKSSLLEYTLKKKLFIFKLNNNLRFDS